MCPRGDIFFIKGEIVELKPYLKYEDQIEKLKSRGCDIEDENFAIESLKHIGYYRLSAYFLLDKNEDGSYKKGTSFNKAIRLYEFDRSLRSIIFNALEIIEVSFRARLAYYFAGKYGPLGYKREENFNSKHNPEKFAANIEREIENNKNVSFVRHHLNNYNGEFPLWVLCELFTFGMISYFYSDMITADKKEFAGVLYHDTGTWLRCCADLRNICAHYGRLYNRNYTAVPAGIELEESVKRKLWASMCAMKMLYPDANSWNTKFIPRLAELFDKYSEDIDMNCIAFPENWQDLLLMTKE